MKTFVINLDKDIERLKDVSDQLDSLKIQFERFPAIYGKTMTEAERLDISTIECSEHCPYSVVGCGSSHIKLWRKIRDEKIPMAMILEDDAEFVENFNMKLLETFKELPSVFDILYLGCIYCKDTESNKKNNFVIDFLRNYKRYNESNDVRFSKNLVIPTYVGGTHSYIITYKGACNILNIFGKLNTHIDQQMSSLFDNLKVYKTYKKLVSQPLSSEQSTQTSNRPYLLNIFLDRIKFNNTSIGYDFNVPGYRIGNYQLSIIQILYFCIGVILGCMRINIYRITIYFTSFQIIDYLASPSKNAYTLLNIGGDFTILSIGYIIGFGGKKLSYKRKFA